MTESSIYASDSENRS